MSFVVHSAASSKCAARRPRTAAQFFEAKKASSDPVAMQTEEIDRCSTSPSSADCARMRANTKMFPIYAHHDTTAAWPIRYDTYQLRFYRVWFFARRWNDASALFWGGVTILGAINSRIA